MDKRVNGCGPAWFPEWLRFILFGWFFEASCNKHDLGYRKGGDEIRRFECDWKFLSAMKRDARSKSKVLCCFLLFVAICYFIAVRLFGWHRFNYR